MPAGRSLSLKLLQQLREQGAKLASGEAKKADGAGASAGTGAGAGRTFREVTLAEPIRCAEGWRVGGRRVFVPHACQAASARPPPLR